MKLIRSVVIAMVFITLAAGSTSKLYGQKSVNHTIKMILLDTLRQTPLEFATAYIIPEGKEAPLRYALSNEKGLVEILKVPTGNYTLKIELLGYIPVVKKITLSGNIKKIDMGKISMMEEINLLGTVVVTAVANPIIVKKDTIEYNASSFKTTESDLLEDLLKKLPGIEVDSEGKITANGKEITKIMIGGKTFFLKDPKLATKNLPADIIEKVKVLEKKSDQAEFTGIDDGESETIIDLSIKPGMFDGWFGNLSGGYGTKDRYQGAGMVAKFTENSQISLLGNFNNTNNRGFTDFSGSMMRSSGLRMSSFFLGDGVTTSWMGGANGNIESKDKKARFAGSYLYNGSDKISLTSSNRQNFLKDSSFVYAQDITSHNNTDGHSFNFETEYKFSKETSILFRPNIDFGFGSFDDSKTYSTAGAIGGLKINDGKSLVVGDNKYLNTDGRLLFRHRLSKPGRTISINFNYAISDNKSNSQNKSETNIYNQNGGVTLSSIIDQQKNNRDNSYSLGTRLAYTEPLGLDYFLELSYMYRFRMSKLEKLSYNMDPVTGKYDQLDPKYSNTFENRFSNQEIGINLNRNREKYNFTIGFNVLPAKTVSSGTINVNRHVVNYAPSARLNYNFTDSRVLRVRYRGRTNQPSIYQLQPIEDNTNPLFKPLGNPDLLPEFAHSLWLSFSDTEKSTFRTIDASLGATYTIDKIVNRSWYGADGIQYTKPVNEQGVYSLFTHLLFSSPIAKTGVSVTSVANGSFSRGVGFVGRDEASLVRNLTSSLSLGEMLRLTYRNDKIEISSGGRVSYSNVWYTIETKERKALWNNSLFASVNWTLPLEFNISSDINRRFYYGYDDDYNRAATMWNAELSKNFLKGQMILRVKVYDILNQSNNIRRTSTDNYIEDVYNNTLSQYVMFSLTYRFGTYSKPSDDYKRVPPHQGGRIRYR